MSIFSINSPLPISDCVDFSYQKQTTQGSDSQNFEFKEAITHLHLIQKRRNLLKTKGWVDTNGIINRDLKWPPLHAIPKSAIQKINNWFLEQKDFISKNKQFEFHFPQGLAVFFNRLDAEVEKNELTPTAIHLLGGYLIKCLLNNEEFFFPFLKSLSFTEEEIQESWLLPANEPQTLPPLDLDMQYWIPLKIEIKDGKVVHNKDCQNFNKIAYSAIGAFAEHSSLPANDERTYRVHQEGFEKLKLIACESLYYYVTTLKNKCSTPQFFEFLLFGLHSPCIQGYFLRQILRLNVRPLWNAIKTDSLLPELTLSAFDSEDPLDTYQALLDQFLGYERAVKVTDLDLHLLTRAIYDITQGYSADTPILNAFRNALSSLNSEERTQALQTNIAKIHNDHQRHFPEGAYTFLLQYQIAMGAEFDKEAASLWKALASPVESTDIREPLSSCVKSKRNYFNECLKTPSLHLLGSFCKEIQKNFFNHASIEALFGSLMPLFLTADAHNFPLRLIEENKTWVARWTLAIEANPDGNSYATSVDFTLNPVHSVKALHTLFKQQDDLRHSLISVVQLFLAKLPNLFESATINHSGWCDWKALRLAAQELLGLNNRTIGKLGAYLILLCDKADRTLQGKLELLALLPQIVPYLTRDDLSALSLMALKELTLPPLQLSEKVISDILESASNKNKISYEITLASSRKSELCALALQLAYEQENSKTLYEVFKDAALVFPEKVLGYNLKDKFSLSEQERILSHVAFSIAPDSTYIRDFESHFAALAEEGLLRCHCFSDFDSEAMLFLTKQIAAKGEIFSAFFLFLCALEIKLLTLSVTGTFETLKEICQTALKKFQASTVSAFWLKCREISSSKRKLSEIDLPLIETMLNSLLEEKSQGAYSIALELCHLICLDLPKSAAKSKPLMERVIEASIHHSPNFGLNQVSKYPKLPTSVEVKWSLLDNEIRQAITEEQWGKVRNHILRIKDFKQLQAKAADTYAYVLARMPLNKLLTGILDSVPESIEISTATAKQWLQNRETVDTKEMASVLCFLIQRMSVNNPSPLREYLSALIEHLETTSLSVKLKCILENKLTLLLDFTEHANLSWQLLILVHADIPHFYAEFDQITKLFKSFIARLQENGFSKEEELALRSVCKQQKNPAILPECDALLKSLLPVLKKRKQWTILRQWLAWRLKWGAQSEFTSYLTVLAQNDIKEFVLLYDSIVAFATKTLYQPPTTNQLWASLQGEKSSEKESKKPKENLHAFYLYQTLFIELYQSSSHEALGFLEHLDPRIRMLSPDFWKTACQESLRAYFSEPAPNSQECLTHKNLSELIKLMDTFGDCSTHNWKTVAARLQANPNPQARAFALSILARREHKIPKQLAAKMTCEEIDLFTQGFLTESAMVYAMLVAIGQRKELKDLRSYPPDWSITLAKIIRACPTQDPRSPEMVKAIVMWHFERLQQIHCITDPNNSDAFEEECLEHELQYVKNNYILTDYFLINSAKIIQRFFEVRNQAGSEEKDPGTGHKHHNAFCHSLIHCLEASFEFEPQVEIRDALISALQAAGKANTACGTLSLAFEIAWNKQNLSEPHQTQRLEICLACFEILLNTPIIFTLELQRRIYSQYFFPLLSAALDQLPRITATVDLYMVHLPYLDHIITPENKAIVQAKYIEKSLKEALEQTIEKRKSAIENVIQLSHSQMPSISENFETLNHFLTTIFVTICDCNLFTVAELMKHFTKFTNLYCYYPQAVRIHPEFKIPQKFVIQGNIIRYLMQLVISEHIAQAHAPFVWAAQEMINLIEEYHEPSSKQYYLDLFDAFVLIDWVRDRKNLPLRELHNQQVRIVAHKLQQWGLFEIPASKKMLWSPYVDTLGPTNPKSHEVQTYTALLTSLWQEDLNANPPILLSIYDCICCLQHNRTLFVHYPYNYALVLKSIFKALQTHFLDDIGIQHFLFFLEKLRNMKPLPTSELYTNEMYTKRINHEIYEAYSECLVANINSYLNFGFTEKRLSSVQTILNDFYFAFEQSLVFSPDKNSYAPNVKILMTSLFNLFSRSKYEIELLTWVTPLLKSAHLWLTHFKEEHSHTFTLCKQLVQHVAKQCILTPNTIAELLIQFPYSLEKSEMEELGKMLLNKPKALPPPQKSNKSGKRRTKR